MRGSAEITLKRTFNEVLAAACLLAGLLAATSAGAQQVTTIRRVSVLNQGGAFELEIDASQPVTPKTQIITGPDRLIIDFPNAVPGRELRPIPVNMGAVKGIRTGLFESTPPVARVVLDLTSPQAYEVYPSGKRVIVKLVSSAAHAMPVSLPQASLPHISIPQAHAAPTIPAPANAAPANTMASNAAPASPPPPPPPHAEVDFRDGKLSISSDRARMIDILHEVQRRIGASLAIPPGTGQEAVMAHLGPAAVRDVLSALLNGSSYNVVLVGSGADRSSVTSIILTTKGAEGESMPANFSARADDGAAQADAPPPANEPPPPPPVDNAIPDPGPPPTDAGPPPELPGPPQ